MTRKRTTVTLGARLRKARRDARLSLDDVATVAQVNKATVFRIEQETARNPRADTVERIAFALNVSPSWLGFGVDAPLPAAGWARTKLIPVRVEYVFYVNNGWDLVSENRAAIAAAARVSNGTISNIICDGKVPTLWTIEALARACRGSPAFLAYGAPSFNPYRLLLQSILQDAHWEHQQDDIETSVWRLIQHVSSATAREIRGKRLHPRHNEEADRWAACMSLNVHPNRHQMKTYKSALARLLTYSI